MFTITFLMLWMDDLGQHAKNSSYVPQHYHYFNHCADVTPNTPHFIAAPGFNMLKVSSRNETE